jgi:ABC-type sugar transport system ATPase subunit
MDEPLSNLDATLRQQTRADIAALQRTLGTTTLYVTHDQVEAMTMGTRIAVMYQGKLQQVGAPTDLYHRPANAFVASFLGNPGMNLIRGTVQGGSIRIAGAVVAPTAVGDRTDVTIGVRAEDLRIGTAGFACEVVIVEDLGSEVHVVCQSAESDRIVIRQLSATVRPAVGETVHLSIDGATHLFDTTTGDRCEE